MSLTALPVLLFSLITVRSCFLPHLPVSLGHRCPGAKPEITAISTHKLIPAAQKEKYQFIRILKDNNGLEDHS